MIAGCGSKARTIIAQNQNEAGFGLIYRQQNCVKPHQIKVKDIFAHKADAEWVFFFSLVIYFRQNLYHYSR